MFYYYPTFRGRSAAVSTGPIEVGWMLIVFFPRPPQPFLNVLLNPQHRLIVPTLTLFLQLSAYGKLHTGVFKTSTVTTDNVQ